MKRQIHSMMKKGLNMLRCFRERINGRVFLKTDLNLSYQMIGDGQMDSCMICTDYFDNIPDLANKKIVIYSAGIANQINFELSLLELLGGGGRTVRN